MKIAVNGSIVDTELIYLISEIQTKDGDNMCCYHRFIIKFLNGGEFEVLKYILKNESKEDRNEIWLKYNMTSPRLPFGEYIEELPEYKQVFDDITEFRDKIVNIWSNNHRFIPRFDLV